MISLFIKGLFIGIGKIIPGVSGAVIAMSFGIYDKLLYAVSHFFKNIKENIKFLLPVVLGVLISIIFSSRLISFLLNSYYIVTMFFFVGLIIGGIGSIFQKVNIKKISSFFFIFLTFCIMLFLSCFFKGNLFRDDYSFIAMFFIGLLEAITMIVPGISGTAIMMLIGCYTKILNMFSNVLSINNLKDFIPFILGVCIGILIVSTIISFCFERYKNQTYSFIVGCILSSILLLCITFLPKISSFTEIIFGFLLFFLGLRLSRKLN